MSARAFNTRPLHELLLALHEAEGAKRIQDVYLRHFDAVVPAHGHGIYYLDERLRPALVQTRGVSDGFLERYEAEGRSIDPLLGHLGETLEPIRSSAWRPKVWRSHPFYAVVASGGLHHILQAPLAAGGELLGTLNVARRPGDRAFTPAEQAAAALVGHHVSVALRRAAAHAEAERRRALAEEVLDLLRVPLLATGLDGTTLLENRAAGELLAAHAAGPAARELARALRRNRDRLLEGRRRVVTATLPPLEPSGEPPWRQPPTTRIAIRSTLARGRVAAIVSFVHVEAARAPLQPAVLSPREQEIVELVARGLTNREIAAAASISRNTVKQHLKRIFGKVQVRSRTELAATVALSQTQDGPFRSGAQEYPPG